MIHHFEADKNSIRRWLNLVEAQRAQRLNCKDNRFVAHCLASFEYNIHINFVECCNCFATICAVGEILLRITSCKAYFASILCGVIAILCRNRSIAISSCIEIALVVAAAMYRAVDEYECHICICRILHYIVVLLYKVDADAIAVVWFTPYGVAPMVVSTLISALWKIDLQTAFEWKNMVVILQHYNRFNLCIEALFHKLLAAYDSLALYGLEICILEQTGAEDILQEAHCRLLKACANGRLAILLLTKFVCLDDMCRFVDTSILVATGHQYHKVTLGDRHILYAPRLARVAPNLFIFTYDSPIGTYDTLVVVLCAEQVIDNPVAISVTNILA